MVAGAGQGLDWGHIRFFGYGMNTYPPVGASLLAKDVNDGAF